MLEIRNLSKVYRPKKGVPVTALDNISLKFADKGMVFLLGKSGSGKSTLLNVLGGLDRYDSGEMIIHGVSSKDFKQSHFDSYRNTYVGFIFQEYNVLEEFSVGANIALALELQGIRATDAQINDILKQVDLEGYGNRKPNELSGGQKQRVAIARALVKNPEIIMADEPTGALDSNTGRQVLETLKRMSADKLVLVVSHDREFAEKYADRIVELADGKIIRDVERDPQPMPDGEADEGLVYGEDGIRVPAGYRLTPEDREAINEYLAARENGTLLVPQDARRAAFRPTDPTRFLTAAGAPFRLIKSKLPMRNAFKIGASGLKHKRFRLVMTVLLSVVAFTLFALSDTFGAYNHVRACTESIQDTGVKYLSLQKTHLHKYSGYSYWDGSGSSISDAELETIAKESGVPVKGVYRPVGVSLNFDTNFDSTEETADMAYDIYATYFRGFMEFDREDLNTYGYTLLSGRLPEAGKAEIAVSEYIYETFAAYGYNDGTMAEDAAVKDYGDLVGKIIRVADDAYTVVGIVDTGFDLDRYRSLKDNPEYNDAASMLLRTALYTELDCARSYSPASMLFLAKGDLESIMARFPSTKVTSRDGWMENDRFAFGLCNVGRKSDVSPNSITWVGGSAHELKDDEILVSANYLDGSSGFMEDADGQLYEWGQDGNWEELLKDHESVTLYLYGEEEVTTLTYRVVGVIEDEKGYTQDTILFSDAVAADYALDTDGCYGLAVGAMPKSDAELMHLVEWCYREDGDERFEMNNSVTFELDGINGMLQELSVVFLWIGVGFAAFAAIMLANFIAVSISYKKQEIGILRAIGSRSNDVFRIFFSESFLIASINFVLSSIATLAATTLINRAIREGTGLLVTILHFGVRQVLLLMAVSVLVAAVASFIPVRRIAAKRPIDAIRDR